MTFTASLPITTLLPITAPGGESLPGTNVLLMGPAGTGKTHSIGTLVDTGIEVFYLALEPGLESLKGYYIDRKQPIPANLHWHKIAPAKAGFAELIDSAEKINTLSYESLAKMVDPARNKHNQYILLLRALTNFVDDRTGETFGSVDTWGPERALVIDGLTGLGRASMSLVVGNKPAKSQPDWGVAQDNLEKLLRQLCDNCNCHFVLLSHVEREIDLVLGGIKITVSTLGRALAPKIAPMFSDVILTTRVDNKWTWDTGNSQADVKSRNLPFVAGQPPTFATIIKRWKERSAGV